jgi:hypothetical protein
MNNAFNATMDSGHALPLGADELLCLREFAKAYQRRLDRLERAYGKGDKKAADHETREILKSFGAKVCVAVRSIKLPPDEVAPSFAEIKKRAETLNPFRPIAEPVITWLEPKASSGYRQLVSFQCKRRALQLMCADILSVAYPAAPFDFSARGKGGVKAATLVLHKLIEEGGYQYVVTADIKDCFASAITKKVGELLPLPEKVVNNVLLIQDDVTVVVKPDQGKWTGLLFPNHLPAVAAIATYEAARRGVPQGSSASGIIMYRAVLGRLLSTLPFADRIVLVGDDVAIPVKDEPEGEAVLEALKSLYASSPVGLLTIGRSSISHIKHGFDFVSYRTTLKQRWKVNPDGLTEWYLHVRPTLRAYEKFEAKAIRVFHAHGGGLPGWKQLILYMKRWMASFPLWKPTYLSKCYLWFQLQAGSWHKVSNDNSVQSIAQKTMP